MSSRKRIENKDFDDYLLSQSILKERSTLKRSPRSRRDKVKHSPPSVQSPNFVNENKAKSTLVQGEYISCRSFIVKDSHTDEISSKKTKVMTDKHPKRQLECKSKGEKKSTENFSKMLQRCKSLLEDYSTRMKEMRRQNWEIKRQNVEYRRENEQLRLRLDYDLS